MEYDDYGQEMDDMEGMGEEMMEDMGEDMGEMMDQEEYMRQMEQLQMMQQ